MKLSDFLPWGQKKNGAPDSAPKARDRRQAARRVTDGAGWVYWADETGKPCRARVTFIDVSEDSSGLGFIATKTPPEGCVGWALQDGGKALPCDVKHAEKTERGFRAGAGLRFEERFLEGTSGTSLQWVDDNRELVSAPAIVKNSGQGLVEISVAVNVPARRMLYLEGPRFGCLAVCRGSRPDGSGFILVAEAASDSFATTALAA